MRELILRLLPQNGVPGVLGVPQNEYCNRINLINTRHAGTPFQKASVPRPRNQEHMEHHFSKPVFQENPNKINAGTPRTPGTSDLVKDIIDGGISREVEYAARNITDEIIRKVFADYEDETKFEIPW
jgi:hypothetical protein